MVVMAVQYVSVSKYHVYTLNLYNVICQLHLNKNMLDKRRKEKLPNHWLKGSLRLGQRTGVKAGLNKWAIVKYTKSCSYNQGQPLLCR